MLDPCLDTALRRLVARIDPGWRFCRAWGLTGGVSAQVTAIEVECPDGAPMRLIVRMHGDTDRSRDPEIAQHEYELLKIAQAHGLAAPRPYYVDTSRELFPHPVIVIDFIEGETVFDPDDRSSFLWQMADELAKIHRVPAGPELAFLPGRGRGYGERPAVLDESLSEGRIRDALEGAAPLRPNAPVLLHGDYWPGNILWRDDLLAAVIDWEDAATGDPLADLANARLETLFALDANAVCDLTDRYLTQAAIDATDLPYWDLCAALRPCAKLHTWGLEPANEQRMRDLHRSFVTQAIERLRA